MNGLDMIGLSVVILIGLIGSIVVSVVWINFLWKIGNTLNKWLQNKLGYNSLKRGEEK